MQGLINPLLMIQLITNFGVIELFLKATLCERTLCETSVRDAPGTESNTICQYSFVERYVRINSCLTESCTDRLF